ncbi:MAG: beta-propeller domain-containing protein [Clostridiales Family XIII bacterium]|nr:beta-propeller domain-containing protein [Clostridiales Family XIII bacterium]
MNEQETKQLNDALREAAGGDTEGLDFFADFDTAKPPVERIYAAVDGVTADGERSATETRVRPARRRKLYRAGFAAAAACFVVVIGFIAVGDGFESPVPAGAPERHISANYETKRSDSAQMGTADGYDRIFSDILKINGYSETKLKAEQEQYRKDRAAYQDDRSYRSIWDNMYNGGGREEATISGAESDGINSSVNSETDFSDTNNQTLGVQEADVIKSDGRYIYAINSEKLNIIEANGANPKLIASIKQPSGQDGQNETYFNMMLTETRLVAMKEMYDPRDGGAGSMTGIDVFDITDPAKPVKLNSLTQSGSYYESRVIGDSLYLFSFYRGDLMSIQRDVPASFIPLYTEAGTESLARPGDILMPEKQNSSDYMLISGIDISGEGTFVSKKSVFGAAVNIYVSERNIYLASQASVTQNEPGGEKYSIDTSFTETTFSRLALDGGKVSLEASCRVPGWVLDQFSMDEYDGVFRVVMTDERHVSIHYDEPVAAPDDIEEGWTKTNAVYTMDGDLNITGSITEIAEDEQVYSARFMGEYAYFVTFLQTDPLFSVDLRDPKNPRIAGALKIPGFSDYLHPYDDGMLFGIGEERSEDGSEFLGVKLSMFDISDPEQVTEQTKLVLKKYSSTPVRYNHKAILVNSDKSLIAFPADEKYVICSYGGGGFKIEKEIEITDENPVVYDMWYGVRSVRGMFIGNYFYVVSAKTLTVYDMERGYREVGGVALGTDKVSSAQPYPVYGID